MSFGMRLLAVGRSVVVRMAAVENHLAAARDQQAVDQRELRRRDSRGEGRQRRRVYPERFGRGANGICAGRSGGDSLPSGQCNEEYDPSKGSRSAGLPQVGLLHLLTPKVKLS